MLGSPNDSSSSSLFTCWWINRRVEPPKLARSRTEPRGAATSWKLPFPAPNSAGAAAAAVAPSSTAVEEEAETTPAATAVESRRSSRRRGWSEATTERDSATGSADGDRQRRDGFCLLLPCSVALRLTAKREREKVTLDERERVKDGYGVVRENETVGVWGINSNREACGAVRCGVHTFGKVKWLARLSSARLGGFHTHAAHFIILTVFHLFVFLLLFFL